MSKHPMVKITAKAYEKYKKLVYKIVAQQFKKGWFQGTPWTPEEVVQEVWVKVLQSMKTYDPRITRLSTWVGNTTFLACQNLKKFRGTVIRVTTETRRKALSLQDEALMEDYHRAEKVCFFLEQEDDRKGIDNIPDHRTRDPLAKVEILERNLDLQQMLLILTPKRREILCRYFGIGCAPQTLREIGKALGITCERVRQLRNQALEKLRARYI